MDATAAPDASPAPTPSSSSSPSPSPQVSPRFEARLRHADSGTRVVEVSAWLHGSCLGRCLGEAASAEEAEDRALARLRARLQGGEGAGPLPPDAITLDIGTGNTRARDRTLVRHVPDSAEGSAPERPPQPPTEAVPARPFGGIEDPAPEPPLDPDDWSEELAELDVHLQRLGWGRDEESTYLQRAFGHPSRSRLTRFTDLAAYLRTLRGLDSGSRPESAAVPMQRRDLISQCDELLNHLNWDASQGRRFLEQHFQLNSRQQLSDEQLLQFNILLEEELLAAR